MKTILMTGVCGVGKSTLSREISQFVGCSWGDYADIMLEVMGENDKDKIQYLEYAEKEAIIEKTELLAFERFVDTPSDNSLYFFENHLSIIQDGEIVTFPMSDYEKYNTVGLVVVEALAKTVLNRRRADTTRARLVETENLINEQQKVNLEEAKKVASHLGIPWLKVINDNKDESLAKIRTWYYSLWGFY